MALTEEQMIEVLRDHHELLNRGEFDAAVELADPEVVVVRPGGLPPLRGVQAVRAWLEPDAFESQTTELLGFEAEGRRVLIRQRTRARGAGSGLEMDIEALTLWTFSDEGKVIRVEAFSVSDEDEARRHLSSD